MSHRTKNRRNKAIVDITLRPRCAIPPPPSRPIGRIACAQKLRILFACAWHTELSRRLHDVIGDWMIPVAANATATLHPSTAAKIANASEWPGQPPKIAPSHWGSAHPSNTWFRGPIRVFIQNGMPINSVAFCTALYNGSQRFPQKLHLPFKRLGPPSNTWYIGPPESLIQTASRSVQPFWYGSQMICCTMHCQWGNPPNCPLPLGFRHSAGEGPSHGHKQHA